MAALADSRPGSLEIQLMRARADDGVRACGPKSVNVFPPLSVSSLLVLFETHAFAAESFLLHSVNRIFARSIVCWVCTEYRRICPSMNINDKDKTAVWNNYKDYNTQKTRAKIIKD